MPLSETAVTRARPKDRPYKLGDRDGLYLHVSIKGSKSWRMNYRRPGSGKQATVTFGMWPDVSMEDARRQAADARSMLRAGQDPAAIRQAQRQTFGKVLAGETFDDYAAAVVAKLRAEGKSDATLKRAEYLRMLCQPILGPLAMKGIDVPTVFAFLKSHEARGRLETVSRLRRFISDAFGQAVALGKASSNPAAELNRVLASPKSKPLPAITDPKQLGALLTSIDSYPGQPSTALALRLLALTFVRPGELRHAEWSEISFEAAMWVIPAEKTKLRREHIVPLSRQALEVLAGLQVLARGSKYVLPAMHTSVRPISENTLNMALRRIGIDRAEHVAHGFRSTASTILNESGVFDPDVIERQLAHVPANQIRGIYNRAQYLPERVRMMQWWADYLDKVRAADPLHIPGAGAEDIVPRALYAAQQGEAPDPLA